MQALSSPFVYSASSATLAQFQFQTLFPHLVECLFQVSPYCKYVLLVLEGIFNSLGDVDYLLNFHLSSILAFLDFPKIVFCCCCLFVCLFVFGLFVCFVF